MITSVLTIVALTVLLVQAWLVREAVLSRRQRTIGHVLGDAAAQLRSADSREAVDPAAGRATSRLGAAPGAALTALRAVAALALDRVRLNAEIVQLGEQQFSALVAQTADVILIVDDDNRIRYASPSARDVFGTSVLRDVALPDLVDEAERHPAEYLLRHARQGDQSGGGKADWTIHGSDGRTARVEVSCRDLRSEESVRGIVVTLRDVSVQRRLEGELTKRVFHDPLTGLPNRLSFVDRVDHAIGTDEGITGVVLINLDDFKAITEGLGRETGDAVLKAFSVRLRESVGAENLVARLSENEFGVLVRGATAAVAVDDLAARITDEVAVPVRGGDAPVSCNASVGVATTVDASTDQELLRHADIALHAATADGFGQWRHYEPSMADSISHRLELRAELGRALQDDSLVVEYQPIVSLDSRRTLGFEALLRWQHPTRGLLSPGQFIDIAEESGLITQIGEQVLATAVSDAREWSRATPHHPPYVSVNVSAQQFRSRGFVDSVHRLLAETGLPPGRLVLEITESLLVSDEDEVWEDLKRLRQSGVRVAIDDFGTGYSALGYLRQTPLDIVKLDRVFIISMATSKRQRDLVQGIVRLAEALGLCVVAEGIENERQREIAASAGCAYGQGYLFSRSMPYADTITWLLTGATGPPPPSHVQEPEGPSARLPNGPDV